jgi:predicted DNA-binding transcriptional regulator YafY
MARDKLPAAKLRPSATGASQTPTSAPGLSTGTRAPPSAVPPPRPPSAGASGSRPPLAAPPARAASAPAPPVKAPSSPPAARVSSPPAPAQSAAAASRARGRPRGPFTQHRRLDALRALLQRHPKGLTIYELARELDVTPRSMRRYLAEVRREMEITPTQSRPGGERVWRLAPGELGRRVEVRRTQAYALLAAQRLFEPMKGSTLYEEIDMVAQKLLGVARRPGRGPNAGVADARLEERFLYLPFAPKDYSSRTEELDALFQAVADLRPLKCRYRRAKDGREERITIHPYAMVLYKDSIYCVGLHVGRGDIRTFLLDRMRDAESATIERFTLPDDFSIEDHFQGQFGIFRGGQPKNVVVDFDPKVAEYVRTRRVHPSQELSPSPERRRPPLDGHRRSHGGRHLDPRLRRDRQGRRARGARRARQERAHRRPRPVHLTSPSQPFPWGLPPTGSARSQSSLPPPRSPQASCSVAVRPPRAAGGAPVMCTPRALDVYASAMRTPRAVDVYASAALASAGPVCTPRPRDVYASAAPATPVTPPCGTRARTPCPGP